MKQELQFGGSLIIGAVFTLFMLFYGINAVHGTERKRDLLKSSMWIWSPLIPSEWLMQLLGHGGTVDLKIEALQPSGSSAIRGIASFMQKMYSMRGTITTFVCSSSEREAVTVAFVARELQCKAIFVLEESQRDSELIAIVRDRYGAEVQFKGTSWNEADEFAKEMASKYHQMEYVPLFEDMCCFNGYSSIVPEIAEQSMNPADCIVVPVTTGALLMGVMGGMYQVGWSRRTKLVAVESENSAMLSTAVRNAFETVSTLCVSPSGQKLGHRAVSNKVVQMVKKFNNFNPVKTLLVRDQDVLNVATLFGLQQRMLIDPQSATAVAAVFKNREYFQQFQRITIIIPGGNRIHFDVEMMRKAQSNGDFNEKESEVVMLSNLKIGDEAKEEKFWDEELDSYDSENEEI